MFTSLASSFRHERDLWLARFYYLAFVGGWGFIFPFINLFYVSLGLNGKQIGSLASASAVISLVFAPMWVNFSRKLPYPRLGIQFALLTNAVLYLLLSKQESFLPILLIVGIQALTSSGALPMSETLAVTVSKASNVGYGSIRVWGSLGWIFTVLAAGWLIERYGYQLGFWGTSLSLMTAFLVITRISPFHFLSKQAGHIKSGIRHAFNNVRQDRTLMGFAAALIAITLLNSGVLQFEYVYLSELGASKQLISVAGILSAVVELPFMLIADRIVRRYGAHRLLVFAFLATLFYRLSVLIFPSVITIMAIRLLGGMSYSIYTVSYIGLITDRTNPHDRGTVMALFTTTLAGLINIIANPLMGALFDFSGAHWLYGFSAVGYAIGLLAMWLTRPTKIQESTTNFESTLQT